MKAYTGAGGLMGNHRMAPYEYANPKASEQADLYG
jgi:hypothetical protein